MNRQVSHLGVASLVLLAALIVGTTYWQTWANGGLAARQDNAIRLVAQHQTASVSLLQRRLRVGYTRAGRLIDMLERRGIVSGYEGSKARNVLISETDLVRILGEPAHAPIDQPVDDLTF